MSRCDLWWCAISRLVNSSSTLLGSVSTAVAHAARTVVIVARES